MSELLFEKLFACYLGIELETLKLIVLKGTANKMLLDHFMLYIYPGDDNTLYYHEAPTAL